jgi:hypothetical protein
VITQLDVARILGAISRKPTDVAGMLVTSPGHDVYSWNEMENCWDIN